MAHRSSDTIGTDAEHRHRAAATPASSERLLRIVVPVVMLALAVVVWQIYVVPQRHAAIHPAAPGRSSRDASSTDWPMLLPVALARR